MKIKPLTQLREMISKALSSQTNLSKPFHTFFIETMELMLTHTGRLNFTQMARCGRSCESRFRQNFKKPFDWLLFNKSFLESTKGHRIAIAIDPCYISKAGKKTPGLDWFWSGCAAAIKKGLEILGISIVDADANDAIFLKAEQTFTDKKRGRKPKCTKGMDDPDSLTGWYLRMLTRCCKQLLSICSLIVADAYFSKESFVNGVKMLGFDLVSRFRDDVRLRYLYTGPKAHKRGRPKKYAGKVDLKNLDMSVFTVDYTTIGKIVCKLHTAIVNAVSLDRDVRVVIVDYEDTDKKRQIRKVFFSTDTNMSARDIFDIYRTRFQLELFFKLIKQNLTIKHMLGCSENAVKTHLWIAICAYLLLARIKAMYQSPYSITEIGTLIKVYALTKKELRTLVTEPQPLIQNQDVNEPTLF